MEEGLIVWWFAGCTSFPVDDVMAGSSRANESARVYRLNGMLGSRKI
jgi:hypothetical protein